MRFKTIIIVLMVMLVGVFSTVDAAKDRTFGYELNKQIYTVVGGALDVMEDSLNTLLAGSDRILMKHVTNIVTLTDADTTWAFTVNDSTVVIARIEMLITTANQAAATNVQLVSHLNAGPVTTSMSADLDFTGIAIGSRVLWDLSNFGNAAAISTIGVPTPASDIFEEACEVPANLKLGLETGESPTTNAVGNVTIWYYSDGGTITAIAP